MLSRAALWLLLVWALLALLAPVLPITPNQIDLPHMLAGPTWAAPFGYDDLGRSVLDRIIAGASTSFIVSVSVISISVVIGTAIGALSAWSGGIVDHVVVRIIDVFLAFPGILLAIALAGILGPGISNVVIALAIVGWVGYARLARAQTLSLKQREHVLAAIALGARPDQILYRHILPLLATPLMVEATFGIAAVIIGEAGLSFLGLGVQPPDASWGSIIRDGTRYMLVAPHLVIAPALCLSLVVLAVNLLGDRFRDSLDVRFAA